MTPFRSLLICITCGCLSAQFPNPGAMAQQQAMQFQMQMSQQMRMMQASQRAQVERRRAQQKRELDARTLSPASEETPMPKPTRTAWKGPKSSESSLPLLCGDTLVLVSRDGERLTGLDQASGKPKWEYPLPLGLEVNPLPFGDDVLLVNKAYEAVVLDPLTGKTRKPIPVQGSDVFMQAGGRHPVTLFPALADHVLLLAIRGMKKPDTPGVLVALDIEAGNRIWMAPLPESPDLDPLVSGPLVITGGAGKVRAFQIADGKSAWTADLGHSDPLSGSVNLGGGRVAICGHGQLVALNGSTGRQEWQRPFKGEPILMAEGERLFYLEQRGVFAPHTWLVALDSASGTKVWDAKVSDGQLPWMSDGRVVVSDENALTAFDAASGKALWSSHAIEQPIQLPIQGTAKRLYTAKYANRKTYIESLDIATGKATWTYPLDEDASGNGVFLIGSESLYFPAPKGVFICLK